jgi:maltose alpha-D-glucosyltransferase/alpha-amylase
MIALRKLFQVFGRGTLTFLNPANRKILAYIRDLDRGDGSHETVLCVANLSRFAQPVSLDLADHAGLEPVEMLGYVPFPTIAKEPYALSLAPYSFLWLELQPASARGGEPQPLFEVNEPLAATAAGSDLPSIDLLAAGWVGLVSEGQVFFETTLRNWLPRQRWFGAKTRTIESLRILDWVEIPRDANKPEDSRHLPLSIAPIGRKASSPRSARLPALPFCTMQRRANRSANLCFGL